LRDGRVRVGSASQLRVETIETGRAWTRTIDDRDAISPFGQPSDSKLTEVVGLGERGGRMTAAGAGVSRPPATA